MNTMNEWQKAYNEYLMLMISKQNHEMVGVEKVAPLSFTDWKKQFDDTESIKEKESIERCNEAYIRMMKAAEERNRRNQQCPCKQYDFRETPPHWMFPITCYDLRAR